MLFRSKDITVSEISTVNIDLPKYTHTETEINVIVTSDKKSFKWNVILDGQEVTDLSECIMKAWGIFQKLLCGIRMHLQKQRAFLT